MEINRRVSLVALNCYCFIFYDSLLDFFSFFNKYIFLKSTSRFLTFNFSIMALKKAGWL